MPPNWLYPPAGPSAFGPQTEPNTTKYNQIQPNQNQIKTKSKPNQNQIRSNFAQVATRPFWVISEWGVRDDRLRANCRTCTIEINLEPKRNQIGNVQRILERAIAKATTITAEASPNTAFQKKTWFFNKVVLNSDNWMQSSCVSWKYCPFPHPICSCTKATILNTQHNASCPCSRSRLIF